jgi:chromosome segregation ATPase
MQALQQLLYSDLPIPVWQILLYAGAISYFMIQRWFKLSFVTSFILVLYWLHYSFRADLVSITSDDQLARAIYYILGFALILLCIFALSFLEVDADALLNKREKEITFLKAQAKNAEKTAEALKAQLGKNQNQDSNPKKKLEKKLNAKIDKLEHRLQEAESLLETRDAEISDLRSTVAEVRESASASEALLAMYKNEEISSKKQLEEELNAKIDELRYRLQEREKLLEERNAEISSLQAIASCAETSVSALKAQLEEVTIGESPASAKLSRELNSKIAILESKLKEDETLLENRNSEITALRARATQAENTVATIQTQWEKEQSQISAGNEKLEEEFRARISELENQLSQNKGLLDQSNTEIAKFKAKASEADKKVEALAAQVEKDQSQSSASKKKLEERFHARITKLENQLKQGEDLLEKRNTEIAELQAKASEAQKHASVVKTQSEKDKVEMATDKETLERQFNTRIEELQRRLQEGESLLEQRNAEIAQLQARASDAETSISALKAQIEKGAASESTATRKTEAELNNKIATLADKIKQGETLLENRNAEIASIRAKAADAEKYGAALKAQLEEDKTQLTAANNANKKSQEEFSARISNLEDQLKEREALIKTRNAEIAEIKATATEASKNASALTAQLEKDKSQASTASRKIEEELNAKIANLENKLRQSETLLQERKAEITGLQAKAADAETNASLRAQFENDQAQWVSAKKKLEDEFNSKIAKLETQLKESETLLQKRNAEIAGLKPKTPGKNDKSGTSKPNLLAKRQPGEAVGPEDKDSTEEDVRRKLHQFQYAVKYLEDEIKEKDRLLGLMAKKTAQPQVSTKNSVDEDFKKKIHQLEQAVKYLEAQGKEKDGLLGLMAKRNRELADLKLKAEERLEALEAGVNTDQKGKENQPDIQSER